MRFDRHATPTETFGRKALLHPLGELKLLVHLLVALQQQSIGPAQLRLCPFLVADVRRRNNSVTASIGTMHEARRNLNGQATAVGLRNVEFILSPPFGPTARNKFLQPARFMC